MIDHGIPDPSEVNIGKLAGNVTTSDTCNTAIKEQRLLGEAVEKANPDGTGTYQEPCWQHLRNIWINGAAKTLSRYLSTYLKDNLDDIDSRLRVSTSIEATFRATEKHFGQTNNYAKGEGEEFHPYMQEKHEGEYLFNVERVSGSRQDIAVEGACAVFWNRPYYVEFLFEKLRIKDNDHILRENLWIIFSSREMTALFRLLAIMHLSICIPIRWLAANTHKLSESSWSVRSMGRVVDVLEGALDKIVNKTHSVLDEGFMMDMFHTFRDELSTFDEFLTHKFTRQTAKVLGKSNTKVVPFCMLRDELFNPTQESNCETDSFAIELGIVAAKSMLEELRHPHKVTSKYLSSIDGVCSWKHTSHDVHISLLGKWAVNDPAERSFGAGTRELQVYGRIDLSSAFAMGQAKINGDFGRKLNIGKKARKETSDGFLYKISDDPELADKLRTSLFIMAMEDIPATKLANSEALADQRQAKQRKQELAKEQCYAKASDKQLDILCYFEKYSMRACLRTVEEVDECLKNLRSKAAKLSSLKENINIRVIGFGWKQFHTPWSKNGVEFTPSKLASHLKIILNAESELGIPEVPPIELPQLKELPHLGEVTADVKALCQNLNSESDAFVLRTRDLRRDRESRGEGDRYQDYQPLNMPSVDELLNERSRIDMYCSYDVTNDDGTNEKVFRWCQGEVCGVSDGKNMYKPQSRRRYKAGEAVMVLWDPIPELDEPAQEYPVRLLPSKWNPKNPCEDGWRLDIRIEY